jgi:dipeptide/tripeptide permease
MWQNGVERQKRVTGEELREAIRTVGVSGAISAGAAAGLISQSLLGLLAATVPFGWVAGIFGLGVAASLPFFSKLKSSVGSTTAEKARKRSGGKSTNFTRKKGPDKDR